MNKLSVLLVVLAVAGASAIHINKLRRSSEPDGSKCTALSGTCATTCTGNNHWVKGLCPGVPTCCVPGAAPAATSMAAPSRAAGGPVCLTFDDGPFPITAQLLDMLKEEGVKGTFFMNCHSGTSAIVQRMAGDGHLLANHMCSHDIMTVGNYGASYGATKAAPESCLTTDAQQKLFTQNVQGTVDMYKAMFGGKLPERAFQLHRFPGDGRFMKCLINKLLDPKLVDTTVVPGIKHLGWTYEIAPVGTFGHVINPSGVTGLAAAEPRGMRAGDVILAHDLHYRNGKHELLRQWIKNAKAAGFAFAIPQRDGSCV